MQPPHAALQPPTVVRADGCASENYPGAQPLAHRRTSDPSGQTMPLPSVPKQPLELAQPAPLVMAIPSGVYKRTARTTGTIAEFTTAGAPPPHPRS